MPEAAETGRPARYCGVTCRRVAERRIANINTLVQKIEMRLVDARVDLALDPERMHLKRRVDALELERERAEARLRAAFDNG